MIKRYAVIKNGVVEQITLWDREKAPKWAPPQGCTVIECGDDLHLGATYDGKKFSPPAQRKSIAQTDPVGADNLTDTERTTLKELLAKAIK